MTPSSYLTIMAPTIGVYKEKGNKFLSFAYPVTSESEVKGHLKILKKSTLKPAIMAMHIFWVLVRKNTARLTMENLTIRPANLSLDKYAQEI